MIQIFINGFIFGIAFVLSFFTIAFASAPSDSGEVGVPRDGYIRYFLSIMLVEGSQIGEVKDSQNLDGLPAGSFQRTISGSCPNGQWAVGINNDNTIKCELL